MEDVKEQVRKATEAQRLLAETMVNLVKSDPKFPIVLGDTTFHLEFNYAAVKKLFRATGKNINLGEIKPEDLSDPDVMAQMIQAGIEGSGETITLEQVESQMRMKHFIYYAYCIQKAMEAAQPDLTAVNRIFGEEQPNGAPPLVVEMPSPTSGPPAEFN